MNFCERLTLLLREKGINKKDFLEDCGLGRNSFSNWEKSKTGYPTLPVLKAISNYLGVSVAYLKGETEDRGETKEKAPTPVKSVEAMYIAELANGLPDQQRKEAVAYLLALRKEADLEKQ